MIFNIYVKKCVKAKDFKSAIEAYNFFDKLDNSANKTNIYKIEKCKMFYDMGNYSEVIKILTQLDKSNELTSYGCYILGVSLKKSGFTDEAEKYFKKGMQLAYDNSEDIYLDMNASEMNMGKDDFKPDNGNNRKSDGSDHKNPGKLIYTFGLILIFTVLVIIIIAIKIKKHNKPHI